MRKGRNACVISVRPAAVRSSRSYLRYCGCPQKLFNNLIQPNGQSCRRGTRAGARLRQSLSLPLSRAPMLTGLVAPLGPACPLLVAMLTRREAIPPCPSRAHGRWDIRCVVSGKVACNLHQPRYPQSFWECGTGLKAHDGFVIPLSQDVHPDFHHLRAQTLSEKHGTHETLLKAFWEKIGFVPGDFMSVGMASKRSEWLRRVLNRL